MTDTFFVSAESELIWSANVEKVMKGENFVANGLSSIIVRSQSDAVHVRSAFSRDDFKNLKSIFRELSLFSLNIWKSRPVGDRHVKILACHCICQHGTGCRMWDNMHALMLATLWRRIIRHGNYARFYSGT